jgi:hypothetical protein
MATKTSFDAIMDAINEYKDLAIQCELEENELEVERLTDEKKFKLDTIMTLIRIAQQDAVIKALKDIIGENHGN